MDKHSPVPLHEREKRLESAEGAPSEHHDKLREHHEQREHEPDTRESEKKTAEHDAMEFALSAEDIKHPHHEEAPVERRHGPITKKQLDHEFNQTMKHIQEEMPPAQRAFSKVIHNKAVEKTADALGATFARPNALLAGSIGAFTLTLMIYIFAKTMGYTLSGFEPIAAFITGWLGGFLYDYLRVMVTGK
jgi:hypothetical protein